MICKDCVTSLYGCPHQDDERMFCDNFILRTERYKETLDYLNGIEVARIENASIVITARQSLEYRVPIKTQTILWDGDLLDQCCGRCEYNLHGQRRYFNFCPICGQAIDWAKEGDNEPT